MELGARALSAASHTHTRKLNPLKSKCKPRFLSMPHLSWDPLVIWLRLELSEDGHIHLLGKISYHVQLFNVKG